MKLLEKFTAVAILLSSMSFFYTLLYGKNLRENTLESINTGELHTGVAIINVILYLLLAMFVLSHYKRFVRAMRVAWPMLSVVAFCLLSTSWSIDPQLTLRRSAFLLGTALAGIYLGARYTIPQIVELLLAAFYAMCGFTLIARVVSPSYVLDAAHNNALRGFTLQKNSFGELMATFFLLLLLWVPRKQWRLVRYASIPVVFGFLLLARSSTSLIVCALVACVIPTLSVLKLPFRQRWPAILFTAVLLGLVAVGLTQLVNTLLGAIGKDATLTGRSTIWRLVLVAISRRPLLGYGFDVFWQGLKGPSLEVIAGSGWLVPSAHNGYLQAALDIGYLGLGLVLANILIAAKRAISYCRHTPGRQGYWPVTFLLFYLLHAITEASLLTKEGLGILLFVTLYTALGEAERHSSARATLPAAGGFVTDTPEKLALA
jgi:exopolysaccharide production protein ExoQ